jgi:sulfatase maturation enzyme AslB (radical SAM superfamily)
VGEVRTNVIYLTTQCNLDCSYCYERRNRNAEGFVHRSVTSEDIDAFVDEVSVREYDSNSSIVIFGGEPLIRMDLVQELMDKFVARKNRPNAGTHFDLVTNGTLVTDDIAKTLRHYQERLPRSNCSLQIEVSYDVSGQNERVYVGGKKSDEAVMAGIKKLQLHGVKFAISYVVHVANANNVFRDIAYCIMALKAKKVTIRWATEELEAVGLKKQEIQEHLRPRLLELFRRFRVPICDEVCSLCDRCHKGTAGNHYYIPGEGSVKVEFETKGAFNHFLRGK